MPNRGRNAWQASYLNNAGSAFDSSVPPEAQDLYSLLGLYPHSKIEYRVLTIHRV